MILFTFGNPLKFGPDSYHNAKGRPSFLHTKRAPEAPYETHTPHAIERGPLTGPRTRGSCRHDGWSNEGTVAAVVSLSRSRPGVDRLTTPLGIDESLAFRAFDKTIIFGHWLSKNTEIGISLRVFPFEKGFYYILVDYFQKIFFKNPISNGRLWGIFTRGFTAFLTCKHRVAKFNFHYTFIQFPYI